jgi:hypothetical protein
MLAYFQTFSKRPFIGGYQPKYPLDYYKKLPPNTSPPQAPDVMAHFTWAIQGYRRRCKLPWMARASRAMTIMLRVMARECGPPRLTSALSL